MVSNINQFQLYQQYNIEFLYTLYVKISIDMADISDIDLKNHWPILITRF